MKRKFAIWIVLGLLAIGIVTAISLNNMNISSDASDQIVEADKVSNAIDEKPIYQTVKTEADFVKAYDKIKDLVAESEIIAYGIVSKSESYLTEYRSIYTKFDLQIDEILKNETSNNNSNIKVDIQGGLVTYAEYFNSHKEIFKDKLSAEEFKKASEECEQRGDAEYIEGVFNGVQNVKDGNKVLLFLVKDDENDSYYVLGSSFYGLYYYDDAAEIFERKIDSRDFVNGEKVSIAKLKEVVLNTKDLSEEIRNAKNTTSSTVKSAEEEQRNSEFDKYK